jgi:DNA-binding transcriptional regulator YhcF (GntR family)
MGETLRRPRRDFDKRYEMLVDSLRSQISMGRLRSGDMISSENQLASQFSISRNSARAAIQLLVDEGLLMKAAGKGTFVTDAAQVEVQHLRIAIPTPSNDSASIVARMREWARDAGGATIDVITCPVTGFEVTARALAEHGGADAILVNDVILRHLDPATIENASDYVNDPIEYLPAAISALTIEGSLKAIPIVCSPTLLAVDEAIVRGSGWPTAPSWADVQELALRSHVGATGSGFAVSLQPHRLAAWLGQNQAHLADAAGMPSIDSARVVETIQFLLSLSASYRQPRYSGGAVISAEQNFAAGFAAGVLTTTINAPDFTERPRPWTIAESPLGRTAFAPLITLGLAIPVASTGKALVRELARWLATGPAQAAITKETSSFPTRIDSVPRTWPASIVGAAIPPIEVLERSRPLQEVGPIKYLSALSAELLSRPFESETARAAIVAAQARAVAGPSELQGAVGM